MAKERTALLFILLAVTTFYLPALILRSGGIDIIYHLLWSQEFSSEFWNGNPYPRLLMDLNAGCGYPIFYFYPPLAYWLTSLFAFAKSWTPEGWYPIVGAAFTASMAGSIGCYYWIKESSKNTTTAALVGALLFVFLPFQIHQFYILFMFSQFVAFNCVPILLLATIRLVNKKPYATPLFAITLAALAMSNISAALLLSPLPFIYGYFLCKKENYRWLTLRFFFIGVTALLLSAIYTLPLLSHLSDVHIGSKETHMWQDVLYYGHNFLFDFREHTLPHKLRERIILSGYTFVSVLFAFLFWKHCRAFESSHPAKKEQCFWLVVIGISVFMMLPFSALIWENIALLQTVQFPWRFSMLLTIGILGVICSAITLKRTKRSDLLWYAATIAFVILTPLYGYITITRADLSDSDFLLRNQDERSYYTDMREDYALKISMSQEYLPITTPASLFEEESFGRLTTLCQHEKITQVEGSAQTKLTEWGHGIIAFEIAAATESTIDLAQFYFPTWRTEEFSLSAAPETGLIRLHIPKGDHQITLRVEVSEAEKSGKYLSLLGVLFLTLSFALEKYKRKRYKR